MAPTSKRKRVSGSAPVTILGLELQYPELRTVYDDLARREKDCLEGMGDASRFRRTKISGVDFALELPPLPDTLPMTTDSDTNKFAMLVWKMLDACDSGSVGGNSCRMSEVLAAAANDTLAIGEAGRRFEHLFGLTLAIANHGVEDWIMRGDPSMGERMFKLLGDAWKSLFKQPPEKLGVSAELFEYAPRACKMLQNHLRSFGSAEYSGTYANVYKFNFQAQNRAKKAAPAPAPASAAKAKGAKRAKK